MSDSIPRLQIPLRRILEEMPVVGAYLRYERLLRECDRAWDEYCKRQFLVRWIALCAVAGQWSVGLVMEFGMGVPSEALWGETRCRCVYVPVMPGGAA